MIRSHVTRNDDPPDEPDPVCETCGRPAADCICPECPVCGEAGNPHCYNVGHKVDGISRPVLLHYTIDQRLGLLELKVRILENQLDELFVAAEGMRE